MQIAFCVRTVKGKHEVYMRVTSFINKGTQYHEFPVKVYADKEVAIAKATKLQEAAQPLSLLLPMNYKTEKIALLPKQPGPVSREAK